MRLITLDVRDNVATAAEDLHAGDIAVASDGTLTIVDNVPRGHKVALRNIPNGADVIRYGEIIGAATSDVAVGQHVHIQNLISKRLPGGDR